MSDAPALEPIELRMRDGVVLRGDRWAGGARTVVLLHGGGQNRWSWRDTAGELARAGFTAIALDARGHGESDWAPTGRYAIDDFVLDLVDVLGQLPHPPAVVGASLGGISGLLASPRLARPLAALVLVDVVARNHPAGVARIAGFMRDTVGGFATLDDAARAIADYLPQRGRRGSPEGLTRTLRLAPDGRWCGGGIRRCSMPGSATRRPSSRPCSPRQRRGWRRRASSCAAARATWCPTTRPASSRR